MKGPQCAPSVPLLMSSCRKGGGPEGTSGFTFPVMRKQEEIPQPRCGSFEGEKYPVWKRSLMKAEPFVKTLWDY